MKRGLFYFITGGARSGKSHYAEDLAAALGGPVTYIATAEPLDEEMAARIEQHRRRRPAEWATVEEPRNVAAVVEEIGQRPGVILIDCLTLLISNLLFGGGVTETDEAALARVRAEMVRLADAAWGSAAHVILVSNEVGLGLVPPYPQGRLYRDAAGWANQRMAAKADRAIFMVSGLALDLKALHTDVRRLLAGQQRPGAGGYHGYDL
ncbi:MAG TPA: bifunctional adenosylcobinamide kinase/adenosylcobinamide-phosphate guanylyltransferase [Syntrophomonadaceae bacterium]|nr:bifunctional adenosylcobinamide kinase/adenosylcobinamide-phosphate guanylyltransferase [Syntrophomonadaceae bacterium]